MTKFFQDKNIYTIASEKALPKPVDILPVGNYTLKLSPMIGPYLEMSEPYEELPKTYGDLQTDAKRIVNTWLDRKVSTGVLLHGEKGSGKTLLTKMVGRLVAELQIPTIFINENFTGEWFANLLQSIEQPVYILFDEFEKVYDDEAQQGLLTMLDGIYSSNKLFLFTCNDKHRVSALMQNRPGRVFYSIGFEGLDYMFIKQYCQDHLKDQTQTEKVCSFAQLFWKFNFDMLKALVQEMNRYNETPHQASRLLNAKPEGGARDYYGLELKLEVALKAGEFLSPGLEDKSCTPLESTFQFNVYRTQKSTKDKDEDAQVYVRTILFRNVDVQGLNPEKGEYFFRNKAGDQLNLIRRPRETVDYGRLY